MAHDGDDRSARAEELLEAAYHYVLRHGITDLTLRPLAAEIGTSPRVLMFLFGSKDGLVREVLGRARADELALLEQLRDDPVPVGLGPAVERTWGWLVSAEHRGLLRLWAETYTRSLTDPAGAWADFAATTVRDWLQVLADAQPEPERSTAEGGTERVLALAVLRGALLHLLATDDAVTTTEAVSRYVSGLRGRTN